MRLDNSSELTAFGIAKFYAYMPGREIVVTVSAQLSWSHFVKAKLYKAIAEAKARLGLRGKNDD
jgi:hypothetical protein